MRAYWFALITTFILPIGLIITVAIRQHKTAPVLLGVLCFVIMQISLRIPLLRYVAAQSWYMETMRAHPFLVAALIALSAGLFEEGGRWFFMKKGKLKTPADCVAFGIGHGGIEALLLVGLNVALLGSQSQILASTPSASLMQTGVERVSAMLLHVGLTAFVWHGLCHRQKSWLWAAVFLHGVVDFAAAYLQMKQVDIWTIEWLICGASMLLFAVGMYLLKKRKVSSSTDICQ